MEPSNENGGPVNRRRYLVAGVVIVVLVASISAYYILSADGGQSAAQSYSCSFSPGEGYYLQVVSDTGKPMPGLAVTGELVSGCPFMGSCKGAPGSSGVPVCPPPRETASILGKWDYVTNGTGFVSVPSSELAGNAFWLNMTYSGKSYQAKSQICGEGITLVVLSLPSGSLSGREVPSSSGGVTAEQGPNGVQTLLGCSPVHFAGIATISGP